MGRPESFRQYAAECVAQAEGEQSTADKNILLNMALAWVRLAQQTQTIGTSDGSPPSEDFAAPDQFIGPPAPIKH